MCVLLAVTLASGACCTAGPRKVAVLITTEAADLPTIGNNSEFWNDTVLTYCMLRKNGFKADDIYVLYGDGTDGYGVSMVGPSFYESAKTGYCDLGELQGARITDYPMMVMFPVDNTGGEYTENVGCLTDASGQTSCRDFACQDDGGAYPSLCPPQDLFQCLAIGCPKPQDVFGCSDCSPQAIEKLEKDDFLLVWWKGHANAAHGDPTTFSFDIGGDTASAQQVASWMSAIATQHRAFVIDTCKSGCLTDPSTMLGAEAMILASCQCLQETTSGNAAYFGQFNLHAPWTFWVDSALWGQLPAFLGDKPPCPATGPGITATSQIVLSPGGPLCDAFAQAAKATICLEEPNQVPQLADALDLARFTRIDASDPAGKALAAKAQAAQSPQCVPAQPSKP